MEFLDHLATTEKTPMPLIMTTGDRLRYPDAIVEIIYDESRVSPYIVQSKWQIFGRFKKLTSAISRFNRIVEESKNV